MSTNTHLIDSATVVLLRDNNAELEVLLLQKAKSINFGGTWVFPGGVIEENDVTIAKQQLGDQSLEASARIAAVRETEEESGLILQAQDLYSFAHWTTPEIQTKRYATWFFIADANTVNTQVTIDEGEIVEARWMTPKQALHSQAVDEVRLNGPSFVTLSELAECHNVMQALEYYRSRDLKPYKPRGVILDDGVMTIYQDDSAYGLTSLEQTAVLNSEPPLHRLIMRRGVPWNYVRCGLA